MDASSSGDFQPTRFISMAASSLDFSLDLPPRPSSMTDSLSMTTTDDVHCQPIVTPILAMDSTRITTEIGSIGCAIDERLNELRAKLKRLEQANPLQTIEPLPVPSTAIFDTAPALYEARSAHIIQPHTRPQTQTLAITDPMSTSMGDKYSRYMQQYHAREQHDAKDAAHLQRSRDSAQSMLARMQLKSQALFQSDAQISDKAPPPTPTRREVC